MRKIRFRGLKRFPYGVEQWYEGDLWFCGDDPCIRTDKGSSMVVEQETIGQYIGIKDMNGTMIYEGDLVKYKCKDEHGKMRFTEPFEIRWNENMAGFGAWMGNEFRCIPVLHNHRLRVVGNIHQTKAKQ